MNDFSTIRINTSFLWDRRAFCYPYCYESRESR